MHNYPECTPVRVRQVDGTVRYGLFGRYVGDSHARVVLDDLHWEDVSVSKLEDGLFEDVPDEEHRKRMETVVWMVTDYDDGIGPTSGAPIAFVAVETPEQSVVRLGKNLEEIMEGPPYA